MQLYQITHHCVPVKRDVLCLSVSVTRVYLGILMTVSL